MARYLSDPIFIKYNADSSYVGKNVKFNVSTTNGNTTKTLYSGSVYATGTEQTIYLNDILYTAADSYDWFRNVTTKVVSGVQFMPEIVVEFEDGNKHILNDVVFATRVPNHNTKWFEIPTNILNVKPLAVYGNGIYPRIPFSATQTSNMFFGFGLVHYRRLTHSDRIFVGVFDGSGKRLGITQLLYLSSDSDGLSKMVFAPTVVNAIFNYANNDTTKTAYIGGYITLSGGSTTNTVKLCEIDYDPAPYYVAWINRFGNWQCQPLHSKYEMTEKVDTKYILTVNNENIPVEKNSEFKWTLNTDWLTYPEHDEFESLLTSKYVYLYNTETEEGHYVTVDDSNWTFRNNVNTNKPFNLTLKLTKSFKQNIIL